MPKAQTSKHKKRCKRKFCSLCFCKSQRQRYNFLLYSCFICLSHLCEPGINLTRISNDFVLNFSERPPSTLTMPLTSLSRFPLIVLMWFNICSLFMLAFFPLTSSWSAVVKQHEKEIYGNQV